MTSMALAGDLRGLQKDLLLQQSPCNSCGGSEKVASKQRFFNHCFLIFVV